MSDYEEDMRIIEAATDGPWEFGYYNVCSKDEAMELAGLNYEATNDSVGVRPQGFGAFIKNSDVKITDSGYSAGKSEDNARYIAHFNPSYTKQLVEKAMERDALAERVKELEKVLRLYADDANWLGGDAGYFAIWKFGEHGSTKAKELLK